MSRTHDLVDPKIMGNETTMHALFEQLRSETPLAYFDHPHYEPFWVLTRHEDIKYVSTHNDLFINNPRTIIVRREFEQMLLDQFGTRNGVETLIHMDNPKHRKLRGVTRDWFKPTPVAKLTPMVEDIAVQFVDKMEAMGGECDFVKDIALLYPLRVIMSILGVAEEEEGMMLKLTQELLGSQDPDQGRGAEMNDTMGVLLDLFTYFKGVVEDRRQNPTDDLASVLANAMVDGERLEELDLISYFILTATGGHDTTSATTAGGLKALLDFPEQFQKLQDNPQLSTSAAKEMIRWVSPIRHMMRTCTEDVQFHGQTLRAGEHLAIWYPAANRDERAIDRPNLFDIERDNRKQLAFGYGGHMCLGQHLAILEVAIFYKELMSRLDWIELAGDPKWVEAVFVGGLKSLPVRYAFKSSSGREQ
ncbi:MAG: cytochrome P450 [Pseudomonadota bacterium]